MTFRIRKLSLVRRAIGVFHGHRLQQNRVDGNLQALNSVKWQPQMGYNNSVSHISAVHALPAQGLQRNVPYSIPESVGNSGVGKNEWSAPASNSGGLTLDSGNNFAQGSLNLISHGRHTLSLKARFGRSCRAFVNAWRGMS